MKIPPVIAARIDEEIAKLTSKGRGHIDDEGIQYKGLPLWGTLGAVWLLRPDGSLWTVDSDLGMPFEPLPEIWHTQALVAGTRRYPWLGELLPRRPPDAVKCTDCNGIGGVGPGNVVFCPGCSALGWRLLPSEGPAT